jgi:hypothetical protein
MDDEPVFVNGPTTVSVYMLDEKSIIIFGELHSPMTFHCEKRLHQKQSKRFSYTQEHHPNPTTSPQQATLYNIDGLILEVCKKVNPEKVDLFLEHEYPLAKQQQHASVNKGGSGLGVLSSFFSPCAPKFKGSKNKDQCPPNLNVHLCDIRDSFLTKSSMTLLEQEDLNVLKSFIDMFHILAHKAYPNKFIRLTKKNIKLILSYMTSFLYDKDSPHHHIHLWETFKRCFKIDKQLAGIENKTHRVKLHDTLVKEMNKYVRSIHKWYPFLQDRCVDKMVDSSQDQLLPYSEDCHEALRKICDPFINLVSTMMDMYLFARVLKQSTSNNVIIYVGNFHARNYRVVLKNLGARLVFQDPVELPSNKKEYTNFLLNSQKCVKMPRTQEIFRKPTVKELQEFPFHLKTGTRVTTGPDWSSQQNRDRKGTVVGYCDNTDYVPIVWDNDSSKNVHNYLYTRKSKQVKKLLIIQLEEGKEDEQF